MNRNKLDLAPIPKEMPAFSTVRDQATHQGIFRAFAAE
jgi:hypothetical protein